MRPIDADALIADILNGLWDWDTVDGIVSSDVLRQTLADIQNMPTIEPRKIAHWNYNGFEWKPSCSECGESCATFSMGKPRDRFCKWCGAFMREETGDDGTK